jgi:hypothetical protein
MITLKGFGPIAFLSEILNFQISGKVGYFILMVVIRSKKCSEGKGERSFLQ